MGSEQSQNEYIYTENSQMHLGIYINMTPQTHIQIFLVISWYQYLYLFFPKAINIVMMMIGFSFIGQSLFIYLNFLLDALSAMLLWANKSIILYFCATPTLKLVCDVNLMWGSLFISSQRNIHCISHLQFSMFTSSATYQASSQL